MSILDITDLDNIIYDYKLELETSENYEKCINELQEITHEETTKFGKISRINNAKKRKCSTYSICDNILIIYSCSSKNGESKIEWKELK